MVPDTAPQSLRNTVAQAGGGFADAFLCQYVLQHRTVHHRHFPGGFLLETGQETGHGGSDLRAPDEQCRLHHRQDLGHRTGVPGVERDYVADYGVFPLDTDGFAFPGVPVSLLYPDHFPAFAVVRAGAVVCGDEPVEEPGSDVHCHVGRHRDGLFLCEGRNVRDIRLLRLLYPGGLFRCHGTCRPEDVPAATVHLPYCRHRVDLLHHRIGQPFAAQTLETHYRQYTGYPIYPCRRRSRLPACVALPAPAARAQRFH